MAKTTKIVGYGISFDMKLVGGVKTADDFKRAAKSIEKSLNRSSNATKQHELQMEALNKAYRKGAMGTKEYEQALNSLKYKELRRQERLQKERRAVEGLDKQEARLAKNRQQRARVAGMAASGVSGLGLGGATAGAARFLGGSFGLGLGSTIALGGGFAGISLVKESLQAYAELERHIVSLQVLFGKGLGNKLQREFRDLAKTTVLTNNQLMQNAKVWASYGLTTEGLTDRLRRLGMVAASGSGNVAESFNLLTKAFAQVNALGKLMGDEKLQLINAGFSLKAIADAAGISMNDFAKAMENGEISADHLNQALVNVTEKGGLFYGLLERQAETISGKFTILTSSWEELLQTIGESEAGPAGRVLDKMIKIIEGSKDFAEDFPKAFKSGATAEGRIAGEFAGESGVEVDKDYPFRDVYGFLPRSMRPSSMIDEEYVRKSVRAMADKPARSPLRISSEEDIQRMMFEQQTRLKGTEHPLFKYIQGMPILSTLFNKGGSSYFESVMQQQRQAGTGVGTFGRGSYADPRMFSVSQLREEARKHTQQMLSAQQVDKDRKLYQETMNRVDLTVDVFEKALSQITTPEIIDEMQKQRMFVPGGMQADGTFSDILIEKEANKNSEEYRKNQEILAMKEEARIESQMQIAKEIHEREKKRLDAEEEAISSKLERELKVARGPADRDAMFTGGSVEEFMFLRRQTQKNETALAVQAAEDRAAQQRAKIAADKKTLDDELLEQVRQLNVNLELARTQDSK